MDKTSFLSAIQQIEEEKGLSKEQIIQSIEMAIAAAYKKEYGKKGQIIRAKFDPETDKTEIWQIKIVVDKSMLKEEEEKGETEETKKEKTETEEIERKIKFNPERHIMLEEARKIKKNIKPGDELKIPLPFHKEYGRIAAQTAKQVIIQKIREAERESLYEEYKKKEGEIVSGIVQRIEKNTVFLDLGRATGVLFPEEQIPNEKYKLGQRLRAYVKEVKREPKGPQIILSRSHPKLVSKLFALEVPEIAQGTVIIKSIAREPGSRTKIAVYATDKNIDPIGAVVGQKGIRVQAVLNELGQEKIDVVQWEEDPKKFIANALSPAKIIDVEIGKKNKATAIVAPDQLSLAIGMQGQNARLAAKLTGWKIDIKTLEEETSQKEASQKEETSDKEK